MPPVDHVLKPSAIPSAVPARVLIVEPHPVCRLALSRLLMGSSGLLTAAAETADLESAPEVASATAADLVLITIHRTDDCGQVERLACKVDARIVVLSVPDDGETVFAALRAGAVGVIPKSAEPAEILASLERVASGEMVIHSSLTAGALMWAAEQEDRLADAGARSAALTVRERTVLQHLARGWNPRQIAERLVLSRRTVEWYLSNIYRKLGVRGRIEAIMELHRLPEAAGLAFAGKDRSRSA